MGWMRTLLLGDIGNRLDIADAESHIAQIRRKLRQRRRVDQSQDEAIQRLEAENEQLELCLGALIQLLLQKGVMTDDEVERLVHLLDDGTDGDAAGR